MSILGTRVTRIEDPRLLTEGGRYTADLREPALEGAVHATFLRSTVAHALVVGVDVVEARSLPGVVDVVTGAEVDLPPVPGVTNRAMARPLLAADRPGPEPAARRGATPRRARPRRRPGALRARGVRP